MRKDEPPVRPVRTAPTSVLETILLYGEQVCNSAATYEIVTPLSKSAHTRGHAGR